MKLWLFTTITLLIFSGCSSKTRTIQLQNKNAQQALLIQKQQAQIDTLKQQLKARAEAKAKAQARARAKARAKSRHMSALPKPPIKNIKLKKVEDTNYSSGYMYPGAVKKKPEKTEKLASSNVNTSMSKAECITMIGQTKFDKYTKMFGSEAASLKRCKMLKAMQ